MNRRDLRRSFRTLLRTAFVYCFVFGWTLFLFLLLVFPVAVVERALGRRQADIATGILCRFIHWGSLPLRLVTPVILDTGEAVPGGRVVVICNHHSIADLYWLLHAYPRLYFIARCSLFRLPGLGWGAWLLGQVPLDENPREALNQAAATLRRGINVALFPEGTRYPEGSTGPFRRGAFLLARETTGLVQPVVVAGTGRVWPRGRFVFPLLGPMGLRVLPPVEVPPTATRADLDRLIDEIRSLMIRQRRRLARELGIASGEDGVSRHPARSREDAPPLLRGRFSRTRAFPFFRRATRRPTGSRQNVDEP